MALQQLLRVLADGRFHSGADLGAALGVSRTAIWKQLRKLEQLGLPLESIRGRGYRLPGGLELLADARVRQRLAPAAVAQLERLELLPVVDSTNSVLMQRAQRESVRGHVCAAEQQSAGRGRRGRPWHSPFARNLYVSAGWEFDGGAAALQGLSLAVGVALVRALERCGVDGAGLKWPNDVLHQERKLAGILLEMAGDAAGRCQVVVGVGLNVAMPDDAAIDQSWTDLRRLGHHQLSRNELLVALLDELLPLLADYERSGFEAWRPDWLALDVLARRPVTVQQGEQRIEGLAVGVDAGGALLLETDGGRLSFNGGEVSVRARR